MISHLLAGIKKGSKIYETFWPHQHGNSMISKLGWDNFERFEKHSKWCWEVLHQLLKKEEYKTMCKKTQTKMKIDGECLTPIDPDQFENRIFIGGLPIV
jgi:hypothetical protein